MPSTLAVSRACHWSSPAYEFPTELGTKNSSGSARQSVITWSDSAGLVDTHRIPVSALAITHPPTPDPPIQIADKPPSTDNSTPFTKLESSEARNSATVAISSG